jgi:hypothetical protein
MKLIGLPVHVGADIVVQFVQTRDGRMIPMRLAVCIEHAECTLMFVDGDDCGRHFRWATPADLPATPRGGVAA